MLSLFQGPQPSISPPRCLCLAGALVCLTLFFLVGSTSAKKCPAGQYRKGTVPPAATCDDIYSRGSKSSGVYTINPDGSGAFSVYCDMSTSGGPWTVFQRRTPSGGHNPSFYQNWISYRDGFGQTSSDHWLGLGKVRRIVKSGSYKMKITFNQYGNTNYYYAQYSHFSINDESDQFRLTVSGFSGTVGDSLQYHSGKRFSTYDRNHGTCWINCASSSYYYGAWWHGCCMHSNLNGRYGNYGPSGNTWYYWFYWWDHVEGSQMMLRSNNGPTASILTCEDCPKGQYQPDSAFEGKSCKNCPAGYFSPDKSASCTACPNGRVQSKVGQSDCEDCEIGKYNGNTGKTTCLTCDPGKFQDTQGGIACKLCETGKFQPQTFQTSCMDCAKGQYQDLVGSSSCKDCQAGKVSATRSQAQCHYCEKGKYQDGSGESKCKKCSRGKFSSSVGSKECKNCLAGRYQPEQGAEACTKTCTCGFFCPEGSINSRAEMCGESFYCPAGTTERKPIGSNEGLPVGSNSARFCGKRPCPRPGWACKDGVAYPLLTWNTPKSCRYNSEDAPYIVEIDEIDGSTASTTFGEQFSLNVYPTMDVAVNQIEFSMARWPEPAPDGCGKGRSKKGVDKEPDNNWLDVQTSHANRPSLYNGTLETKPNKVLDAEACTHDYAATIRATMSSRVDGEILGQASCYVNIRIGNKNERPSILSNTLSALREVEEGSLPGFTIGPKLQAYDSEVSVGLQQLTWKIVTCQGFPFNRDENSGSPHPDPDMIAAGKNCPLRVSSCDGQVSVASGATLNYEEYTKYKLVVQVTDDGVPAYTSNNGTVFVNILPRNDNPTIATHQIFYIEENVDNGTFVNLKNASGGFCDSNPNGRSDCEIVASDVDSDKVGFKFFQTVTQDPFEIGSEATRHSTGKDLLGNDAYKIFTTIKFVPTEAVAKLDYESGNNVFDLTVYAQDGDGARSLDNCMVTIIVIDVNDKPRLDISKVTIEENNNEGPTSDREVNLLDDVYDPDGKVAWECCRSVVPFQLQKNDGENACSLSKLEVTSTGFKALAQRWNFESDDSCDIRINITDKGGQVSAYQDVRIELEDVNDPPQNISLAGGLSEKCSVDENTMIDQQLNINADNSCQIFASDEDDTILTYFKSSTGSANGSKGLLFSSLAGSTDDEKWASLNYLNLETNGKFTVAQVPDYETAKSVSFDVYARDSGGRLSPKKTITIDINDVNEPPVIDSSMELEPMSPPQRSGRINGDNMRCNARFTTTEYRKNDGSLIDSSGSIVPLFNSGETGSSNAPMKFLAEDPDQSSENHLWSTLNYSLTDGHFDGSVFTINETGVITPKVSMLELVDFELLSNRVEVPDGYMRINIVASDAGGQAADCDVYVRVIDLNEAPVIDHLYGLQGESRDYAFVLDVEKAKVGDLVGPQLPAKDPDIVANDVAFCREANLSESGTNSDDDRELFGITKSCQIFVKNMTSGTKQLRSGRDEFYTLYVEAYDSGGSDGVELTSAKRSYYIHGITGTISPVFSANNIMFKKHENSAGIVDDQNSSTSQNYSHWISDPGFTAKKLFVACTDNNVYQRGTTNVPSLNPELNPACSTYTQQQCEGAPGSGNFTKCEFDQALNTCVRRQQALRYKVVPSTTLPEKPESNLLEIDSVSAELSWKSGSTPSNYEDLLNPNENILCDLGPPVRSGDGSESNPYRWIGRYPNGVKGICRMYDEREKRRTGKKAKLSYVDAAALCAKGGSRLPTLNELHKASTVGSAVTAEGSGISLGADQEPASTRKGGEQGDGAHPLRPLNILDLWNWEQNYEQEGSQNGYSVCRRKLQSMRTSDNLCADGSTTNPCKCLDTSHLGDELKVWTYDAHQAKFSIDSLPSEGAWGDPSAPSVVSKVVEDVNMQEELPVLCYVGENWINPQWIGNEDTPAAYSQNVSKPVRGYSALITCMDTSDYTIDEARMEYGPQPLKDEKYIFVEIENVAEDPSIDVVEAAGTTLNYFGSVARISVNENNEIGFVAANLTLKDEDPGDAMDLSFSLTAQDSIAAFQLGFRSQGLPNDNTISVSLLVDSVLDYELKDMYSLAFRVTDQTGGYATQSITVEVIDVNEPPELRNASNPSQKYDGANGAIYDRFQVREDAGTNSEIGELKAWDPDARDILIFSITGSQNQYKGNNIFAAYRTNHSSTISQHGGTEKLTVYKIVLQNGGTLDYETKRLYTLDVTVTDGDLVDQATVNIEVLNVNDVTVEDITVLSGDGKTMETSGNQKVQITGTNFGIVYKMNEDLKPRLQVSYGRIDKDPETQWFRATGCALNRTGFENKVIICDSAPGFGANLFWNVVITTGDVQEGAAQSSVVTDYATPVITSILMSPAANAGTISALSTRGGQRIQLTGTNFGVVGLKLEGYYSSDPLNGWYCARRCVVTTADVEAECDTVAGVGYEMAWKLEKVDHEWFGRASSVTTSYEQPLVTKVSSSALGDGKEFSTHGNEDVFLTGNNFGPLPNPSDTCSPSDPGGIFVQYSNFNGHHYKQQSRCQVIKDQTQIKCSTLPGVSRDFRWLVTVAGQDSPWSSPEEADTTFYTAPKIKMLRGAGAFNANTEGGQKFYVEGDFFGPQTFCAGIGGASDGGCIDSVEFWSRDNPNHKFRGEDCVVRNAQTLIECTSPPGVGKDLIFRLSVGNQTSLTSEDIYSSSGKILPSYAQPVVSVLSRSTGPSLIPSHTMLDADTRGYQIDSSSNSSIYALGKMPETVLIQGANFGPISSGYCRLTGSPCMTSSDCFNGATEGNICLGAAQARSWNPISAFYQTKESGEVGNGNYINDKYNATNCRVVKAHTMIKCEFTEGAGKGHEWVVKVGGQFSASPTSSYHQPEVFSITGDGAAQGRTNGLQQVILHGRNFGPYANGAVVTYGPTGTEYIPRDCTVISHQNISCKTVPGFGKNLFWQVTVREQTNELSATTSYASPYIHSATPMTMLSADGSDLRDFLIFLNVSNSGLQDPLAQIVVQMDPACKIAVESCGPYEIPIEPMSPKATRQEGNFDILAFRLPMLKNKKNSKDIAVSILVYKREQNGGYSRNAAVKSINSIPLSYSPPKIDQIIVVEHPTIIGMRMLTLIGKNFGSIDTGEYPNAEFAMQVNDVPLNGGVSKPIPMQLGVDIRNKNRTGSYVQKWERGAQNERHDEIVMIWSGTEGRVSITRGGMTSNSKTFNNTSPKLLTSKLERIVVGNNPVVLKAVPTLGSVSLNSNASSEIKMEVTCKDCGSARQYCCETESKKKCDLICHESGRGIPKLVEIWLGSVRLPESELQRCPIVAGESVYDEAKEIWTYRCQIPPYQGSMVDARIKFDNRWSNATYVKYLAPTIESLSASVGGTKGNPDNGFTGEQKMVSISDVSTVLKVRTRGERIKITGQNFGKPFAGDITGFNQDYVILNDTVTGLVRKIRPKIEDNPPHGGLSILFPSGTSNHFYTLDVQVGQFKIDIQSTRGHPGQVPAATTTMRVTYRKPTIVAELLPLWRFDKHNSAGGFNVTIYGYDFMTAKQASESKANLNRSVKVWFRAEYNETSKIFTGTPCIPVSTSYTKLVCQVEMLVPTETKNIEDDVALAVIIDGQVTTDFLSQEAVRAASLNVMSGSYTEDEFLIKSLTEDRERAFQDQIERCMELSNGLIPSLDAYKIDPNTDFTLVKTEQDTAFRAVDGLLTERQKEIRQCVSVVVTAFNKACSGNRNVESDAILEAAYKKDESDGRLQTRTINLCATTNKPPLILPDSPGQISGTPDKSTSIKHPEDLADVPTPSVVSIKSAANVHDLPTQGGDILFVKTQGLTIQYGFSAYLVDPQGIYLPIRVRGGVSGEYIFQDVDYKPSGFFGLLTIEVPPGQGKLRRLILESSVKFSGAPLRSETSQSDADTVGYGRPWVNTTLTSIPLQTSTDSCLPNQYESTLSWASRVDNLGRGLVDGVEMDSAAVKELDEEMFKRRCLKFDTVDLWGGNFGADTSQIKVWVEGNRRIDAPSSSQSNALSETVKFWVYNGSAFTKKMDVYSDILDRGFAGESKVFSLVHTHNHLVLRAPRGYGKSCKLFVMIAGQTTTFPIKFSFRPPKVHRSEPRAYDARGGEIVIHGQNFGGVESTAKVMINGEPCSNATWNLQHSVVGLPYISCMASETITGIANVSVYVAGQQSSLLMTDSLDAAGVRTVCLESEEKSDVDLDTGEVKGFWGRSEPTGELCAPCQEGSFCKPGTYEAPTSLSGHFMVELDISNSNADSSSVDESLILRRERRDYSRSLETFKSTGKRVCPKERLFDPEKDADLRIKFPFAASTKRELCTVAMPCKPSEACVGENGCKIGYEYQKLRCNASDARRKASDGRSIVQACNHTLQCQSRSNGLLCVEAVASVCKCPPEWELGSRGCLKACVSDKDQARLLESAGCTLSLLERSLAGIPCQFDRPEDCAKCEVDKMCVTGDGVDTGMRCSARSDCTRNFGFDAACKMQGQCQCKSSSRCIFCTAGTHYRLNGKCEECPENPELIFALFFVGIFLAISFAYVLDQKNFNLAFLIIPVDYFQVLALLSRADIRWPPLLLSMLRALQFFNFNIDIATPECLLAGVFTYEMKFYMTLLFAPIVVILLLLAYCWHQIYHRCFLQRSPDKLYSSKLVGTFMLLIYCVYLSCTTRALEVFNCSPTDPDDGWEYVDFTDLSCDGGGLCRCWDPEHLPYKLLFPAILAVGLYTFGFPIFLIWLLRCGNRKSKLKEDQILRALGLGDSPRTNERAYHLRVRYHKMYYYYKPGKVYWILVILARKVGIAFCSLIFRTNPGFMLASILLVLFIAFSLQTRHSPYMSTSQRQIVVAEHSIKAEAGDATHRHIQKNIEHVRESQSRLKSERSSRMKQSFFGSKFENSSDQPDTKKSATTEYFFDYNTVELTLLFCAVLVCLSGVMFESDRFQAVDAGGSLRYAWQRDMVTYMVILIVLVSFIYLGIVMANEITGWTPKSLQKCFRQKNSALMNAANTIQRQRDDHVEMNIINPSLVGNSTVRASEREDFERKRAEQDAKLKQIEQQAVSLTRERRKLRGKVARASIVGTKRGKGKTGNIKKTEFSTQRASFGSETSNPIVQQKSTKLKKSKSFRKHRTADGDEYYSDISTNETTWTVPDDAIILSDENAELL